MGIPADKSMKRNAAMRPTFKHLCTGFLRPSA